MHVAPAKAKRDRRMTNKVMPMGSFASLASHDDTKIVVVSVILKWCEDNCSSVFSKRTPDPNLFIIVAGDIKALKNL